MKKLFTLIEIGLLSVLLVACGSSDSKSSQQVSSSTTTGKTSTAAINPASIPPAPVITKTDSDKDNDIGAPHDDTNNSSVLDFGHAASSSDKQAITTLIKHYYAAAYAENGAKACSMIYSTLAESVPEDYGQSPPGQSYMRGTTCPAVMTLMFKHFHPQIAVELPKLDVARVRLLEHHGFAVLHFGTMPEREVSVLREGHTWKLEELLDSEIP